jgi:hypothetical protein
VKVISLIEFPTGGDIIVYADGSGIQRNIPTGPCHTTKTVKRGWFRRETYRCDLPTVYKCIVCNQWVCSNHATALSVTAWDYQFDLVACADECWDKQATDPYCEPVGLAKARLTSVFDDPNKLRRHKVIFAGMGVIDLRFPITIQYAHNAIVC